MDDLVSVVIPYYNNEKNIIRALKSVFNQTYKHIELILINDGSEDRSFVVVEEYIKAFSSKYFIQNITQVNKGPSAARNKGILLSRGKFIAFLDADDSWEPQKIEIQINLMIKYNMDMLGCNMYINREDGTKKERNFTKKDLKKINFKSLMVKHFFATPCVICKKDVLLDVGMFNIDQKYMEDSLLFSLVSRKYNSFMCKHSLVNIYKNEFGDSGLSGNLLLMEIGEIKNFVYYFNEKYINIFELIIYLSFSLIKFIRREFIIIVKKMEALCKKN